MRRKSNRTLVTPEEAVHLGNFLTSWEIEECMAIRREHNAACAHKEPQWRDILLLATAWNAGKVHGIRSERLRRRTQPISKPTERQALEALACEALGLLSLRELHYVCAFIRGTLSQGQNQRAERRNA